MAESGSGKCDLCCKPFVKLYVCASCSAQACSECIQPEPGSPNKCQVCMEETP